MGILTTENKLDIWISLYAGIHLVFAIWGLEQLIGLAENPFAYGLSPAQLRTVPAQYLWHGGIYWFSAHVVLAPLLLLVSMGIRMESRRAWELAMAVALILFLLPPCGPFLGFLIISTSRQEKPSSA